MVEGQQGVRDGLVKMQDRAAMWLKDGGCIC